MNPNGEVLQNDTIEHLRGNSYRPRAGARRGRSRGAVGDRSGQQRIQNTGNVNSGRRYQSHQTEPKKSENVIQEPIDINDSAQFPSIQESTRVGNRASSSHTSTSVERNNSYNLNNRSTQVETYIERNEFSNDTNNRRSTGSYRGYHSGYNSNQQQVSNSGSYRGAGGYPDRNNQSSGNRPRGRYYYFNTNRGYQSNNNRRYSRPYQHPMQNFYFAPDSQMYPIVPTYEGPPLVSAYPQPMQYPYHDMTTRPKDPIKQAEYYFSAENLSTDSHLRSLMDKEGWVDIHEIGRFNRMEHFNLRFDDLVNCLTRSELLEVDIEKKKVRTKDQPQKWPLLYGDDAGESSVDNVSKPGGEMSKSIQDSAVDSQSRSFQDDYSSMQYYNTSYPIPRGARYPQTQYQYYQSYYQVPYGGAFSDIGMSNCLYYPPQYMQSYYEDRHDCYFESPVPGETSVITNTDSSKTSNKSETNESKVTNQEEPQDDSIIKQMSDLSISGNQVSC